MVNFTSLKCENQTEPSCNPPTPVYDEKYCCFKLTCPRCVANDGRKYEPGDTWDYRCKRCTCMQNSKIICSPITCEKTNKTCLPGSQLVGLQPTDGTCCPKYQCVCQLPSKCRPINANCNPGFRPQISMKDCCPIKTCERKGVCVKDGIEYLPGSPIYLPPKSCHECNCTYLVNHTTNLNEIHCKAIICNTTCELGEVYTVNPRQCCGSCVQNGCVVTLSTGEKRVLRDGGGVIDDYCRTYTCAKVNGRFITTLTQGICKENSTKDCGPGQEFEKLPGACCGKCIQKKCVVVTANEQVITLQEGQTIISPDDVCTKYYCRKSLGQLVIVEIHISCAVQSQADCGKGEVFVKLPGECCGKCIPKYCVVTTATGKEIPLEEGKTIISPDDVCTKYSCKKLLGQLILIEVHISCAEQSQEDCEKGQVFVKLPGECCGKCIQKSCVIKTANGDVLIVEEGQTVTSPDDICIKYNCKKVLGHLVVAELKTICKYYSQSDCEKGQVFEKLPGECCGKCIPKYCVMISDKGIVLTLEEGQTIPSPDDICIKYNCKKILGQLVVTEVQTVCKYHSQSDCEKGEVFEKLPDECCGKCIPKYCVVTTEKGTVITLEEGKTIISPDDVCTKYSCKKLLGKLILIEVHISCAEQSQADCEKGYRYEKIPNQCCGHCVPAYCVYVAPNAEVKLLNEGDIFKSDDSCTTVTCEKISGQLVASSVTTSCAITSAKDCKLGYTYQTVPKQCCGTCVQTECVFTTASGDLQTLQNGESLPDSKDNCTSYNCKEANGQYTASEVTKACEHKSAKDCHDGEEFQRASDQCCGQCVQKKCLIIDVDGVSKPLNVGETYTSKINACKSYGCIESRGQLYSVLIDKSCAPVNKSNCESGDIVLTEDGCCQICKAPKLCGLVHNFVLLNVKGCFLLEDVPYCTGVCMSKGTFEPLPESNANEEKKAKKCICCDTEKSTIKKVKLRCADGTIYPYEYEHIEQCGCKTLLCQ